MWTACFRIVEWHLLINKKYSWRTVMIVLLMWNHWSVGVDGQIKLNKFKCLETIMATIACKTKQRSVLQKVIAHEESLLWQCASSDNLANSKECDAYWECQITAVLSLSTITSPIVKIPRFLSLWYREF